MKASLYEESRVLISLITWASFHFFLAIQIGLQKSIFFSRRAIMQVISFGKQTKKLCYTQRFLTVQKISNSFAKTLPNGCFFCAWSSNAALVTAKI